MIMGFQGFPRSGNPWSFLVKGLRFVGNRRMT